MRRAFGRARIIQAWKAPSRRPLSISGAPEIERGGAVRTVRIPHYSKRVEREEVEVVLPGNNEEIHAWATKHKLLEPTSTVFVGLDVEWRPAFRVGERNKVALVQLATSSSVILVQLNRFQSFPKTLAQMISHDLVHKVGVGVLEDLKLLKRDYDVNFSETAFTDLNKAVKKLLHNDTSKNQLGLQTLAKELLGVEVPKPKRVRLGNWENVELTHEQICYAAYDAVLSYDIHKAIAEKTSV